MKESDWVKELRKGSIQICILSLLSKKRMYGFEIVKRLRELSNGYFDLKEGTLYPALHRLEKRGYLKSEWIIESGAKPRKYYMITDNGIRMLKAMESEWSRMVNAVDGVLKGEVEE